MLKIGISSGVDGYLTSDVAEKLLREKFSPGKFEITLLGIKEPKKELDLLLIHQYNQNVDINTSANSLKENGILILNSDEKRFSKIVINKNVELVTFGFNKKSSITMSSVVETDYLQIQCCIQRSVFDYMGNEICPQEFSINVYEKNLNIYDAIGIISIIILSGVNIEEAGSKFDLKQCL